MFKCGITGKMSKPGEKCHRIIISRRPKTYYKWVRNEDNQMVEVEAARGYETVKEVNATKEGLAIWNAQRLEEAQAAGFDSIEAHEHAILFGLNEE